MVGIVISLLAAILYSLGGVMQHRPISRQAEDAFDTGGLQRGIRQPMWLGGLAVMAIAVLVQLVALASAPLVTVQTIMTTMIFWVLVFAVLIEGARLGRVEYFGSCVVAGGVVAFVLAVQPTDAAGPVDSSSWAVATAVSVAWFILSALMARVLTGAQAAAVLGSAAGVLNVMGAGLASAALLLLAQDGASAMLTSWLPYGAITVIVASVAAMAMAFAAGPVTASIPPMIAANPVVGFVLSIFVLHQPWQGGATATAVALGALAVMVAGIVLLSRSPVVAEQFR